MQKSESIKNRIMKNLKILLKEVTKCKTQEDMIGLSQKVLSIQLVEFVMIA